MNYLNIFKKLVTIFGKKISLIDLATKVLKSSEGKEIKKVETLGFTITQLSLYTMLFISILYIVNLQDTYALDFQGQRVSLWVLLLPVLGLIFLSILKDVLRAFTGDVASVIGTSVFNIFGLGAFGGISSLFFKIFSTRSSLDDVVAVIGQFKLVKIGFTVEDYLEKGMFLVEKNGVGKTIKREMLENLLRAHPEIDSMSKWESLLNPIIASHVEVNRLHAEQVLQAVYIPIPNPHSVGNKVVIASDVSSGIVSSLTQHPFFSSVALLCITCVAVGSIYFMFSGCNPITQLYNMSKNFKQGVEKDLTLTAGLADVNCRIDNLTDQTLTLQKDTAIAVTSAKDSADKALEGAQVIAKAEVRLSRQIADVLEKSNAHTNTTFNHHLGAIHDILQIKDTALTRLLSEMIVIITSQGSQRTAMENLLAQSHINSAWNTYVRSHPDTLPNFTSAITTSSKAVTQTASSSNL